MDKRKFSRAGFHTAGRLLFQGRKIPFELINIALKGALVKPAEIEQIPTGSEAILEIKLQGSDITLTIESKLVHREGDRLGFRFKEIDIDSMIHLRRLLEFNTADVARIESELAFLKDV